MGLISCSDNDYTQLDKGNDTLTLTANQSTSVLNESNHANDAITLTWTTGTNYGTARRIYYKLELSTETDNFTNPYVAVNEATQLYNWSINQENLNNLLLEQFGIEAGTTTTILARISAIVEGIDENQTSTVSFSVTPYKPVTSTLYIIGSATSTGWDANTAQGLTRTDNGIFTWEGNLQVGTFKFITTRGQFLPSYNRDSTTGGLVYRSSDSEADNQFEITEAHYYKVSVNLLAGTITVEQAEGAQPLYDQLFFVGDMTGWGFSAMTQDPLDNFLFRYGGYFSSGGEFKFGTANGSWENMYKATQHHAPYSDTNMTFVSGYTPDEKWYLQDSEAGKACKICVDIRSGQERMLMREFIPYDMIYLVGDATPNGWDLANAIAMTAVAGDPYTFTWTGTLNAGELKFSCDKQADWNGAWFMCSSGNDVAPTGSTEHALFIDKSDNDFRKQYIEINVGDIDQKWKVASSGTYTITLNQLTETVSIVQQ